jgi:hypothetical protein
MESNVSIIVRCGIWTPLKLVIGGYLEYDKKQEKYSVNYSQKRYFQRFLAAFLAISDRFLAVIPAARAFPPMRPSATAAAFFPSSVVRSSISPVAILPIMMALPMASAGRRSPLGPRGMSTDLFY